MAHDNPAVRRAVLASTEAQLFVADLKESCDFYIEKFGFHVVFANGDPPTYAQVARDRAFLNLRVVRQVVFAGDIRQREELLSATLTVSSAEEVEHLFSTCHSAEVPCHQTLTQRLGRTHIYRSGSRWKSDSLCRAIRLNSPICL